MAEDIWEGREARVPPPGNAVAVAEAARDGFATGLVADYLAEIAVWHGCPYIAGSLRARAWTRAYEAGRVAALGVAGSFVGSEP